MSARPRSARSKRRLVARPEHRGFNHSEEVGSGVPQASGAGTWDAEERPPKAPYCEPTVHSLQQPATPVGRPRCHPPARGCKTLCDSRGPVYVSAVAGGKVPSGTPKDVSSMAVAMHAEVAWAPRCGTGRFSHVHARWWQKEVN